MKPQLTWDFRLLQFIRKHLNMADGRYRVAQIKGAEPETFWIIWEDAARAKGTMHNYTESELRAELEKFGRTKAEIDSLLEHGRTNPVRRVILPT